MISAYNRSTIELEWIIVKVLDVVRRQEVAGSREVASPSPGPVSERSIDCTCGCGYNCTPSCH